MPVLTFRISVPAGTHAVTPVTIDLNSSAHFIKELILPYTLTTGVDNSKCGFRLYDRGQSRTFIPEVGSADNGVISNSNEAGWAPILIGPQDIPMLNQPISGPPYRLTLAFYNETAGALVVVGFIIVSEVLVEEERGGIYEIVTAGEPAHTFLLPTNRGALPMEAFGVPTPTKR